MTGDHSATAAPGARSVATEPLLERITRDSLDADYSAAAQRRIRLAGAPDRPGASRLRPATTVAVAVFGVLVAVAAVQTSRNAPDAANSREALIAQIQRRQEQVEVLQARLLSMRRQTAGLATDLERTLRELQGVEDRASRLRAATGFGPVSGPGVRAVVDDAPTGQDEGRVRDEDLAKLVDGLWNAGAEAVAVNGQRLTSLSSIRTSGLTVHVNNKPLSPPYVVLAVGDSSGLQSRFADSTHGLEWLSLVTTFGFSFEMRNEEELTLPGDRLPALRQVSVARRGGIGEPDLRKSSP